MKYLTLSLLLLTILLMSCGGDVGSATAKSAEVRQDTLPASFVDFYEKFHADTAYQVAHITFPLQGKPSEDVFGPGYTDFRWTRDGWKYHQPVADDDDTFEKKYMILSPELVVERIQSPEYGFYMERRFALMSDGWNLIYFMDMQKPAGFME